MFSAGFPTPRRCKLKETREGSKCWNNYKE